MSQKFLTIGLISILFLFGSISSPAAVVSVSADFTLFQLGDIYSADHAREAGVSVNGSDVFYDPDTMSPSEVTVPVNGNEITFGYQSSFSSTFGTIPNSFKFDGNTGIDVGGTGSGNPFLLGTLSFTNGQFYPLAHLGLILTTHSSDPLYDNHQFIGTIDFVVSNPDIPYTPEEQADYFYFANAPELGSVKVYDSFACPTSEPCGSGSVDLYGYINSLHLSHFANPREGTFVTTVPEPTNVAMLLLGLTFIGYIFRRNKISTQI